MKPFVRDGLTFAVAPALAFAVQQIVSNEIDPPHAHVAFLVHLLQPVLVLAVFALSAAASALGFALGGGGPRPGARIAAGGAVYVLLSLGLWYAVPLSAGPGKVLLMAGWLVAGSGLSALAVARWSGAAR